MRVLDTQDRTLFLSGGSPDPGSGERRARISVALCTYNGEAFLEDQLESIAAQERVPDELLVIDDASADRTMDIARAFASEAPFMATVSRNTATLGVVKNFAKAICLCRGDLIALADQDDIWRADKLAVSERVFTAHPDLDLLFSNGELVDAEGHVGGMLWDFAFRPEERRLAQRGDILRVLANRNVATGATMVFRSSVRELVLPFPDDGVRLHDGWMALLVAAAGRLCWIDDSLIRYRRHAGQEIGVGDALGDDRIAPLTPHELYSRELRNVAATREALAEVARDPRRAQYSGALEGSIATLADLEEHLRVRRDLPRGRLPRVARVFREVARGRYGRHSRGLLSIAKDIVEARPSETKPSR